MPIYISRGCFTSAAVKGMLAKPENREEAVAKLFKSVGGRLIGWYLTFGHYDWLAIGEFPDEKAAASAILAAAGGGSLSDIETTVAALHEAPAGSEFPGLHLDASVKGHVVDVYISPASFASKYGVKVAKGDYVHIVGTEMKSGTSDVVVARSISTGSVDKRTGIFREDMTIYLWNDAGPLWQ